MLNKVIIMGRLTRDPEIKKVNSDISCAAFLSPATATS